MDNMEISFLTKLDKARGNENGSILERFIESRASTIFVHPSYYMDGPGPSISVSGPHEDFSTVILGYE